MSHRGALRSAVTLRGYGPRVLGEAGKDEEKGVAKELITVLAVKGQGAAAMVKGCRVASRVCQAARR